MVAMTRLTLISIENKLCKSLNWSETIGKFSEIKLITKEITFSSARGDLNDSLRDINSGTERGDLMATTGLNPQEARPVFGVEANRPQTTTIPSREARTRLLIRRKGAIVNNFQIFKSPLNIF
ncbi:hypothetical protein AVEN_154148-1 [Araneus ventricosus]|uniref:Uncharacterized protein n=1 Tax=Araneus ventricosus TaxID=182803 RepID=A0A4Y2I5V6_ARAVE|nr:hypothetical protein AVEN_154148-1 [Araneus ventricosus]